MSHKTPTGIGVYLETFGCQMNVLDTELIQGQLRALGYRFIDDWREADVVLYNTCSVREQAENKVYSRLGLLGLHKRQHPDVVVGVLGCMAERDGVAMLRRYPQVDVLCGPGELDRVPMLIDNAIKTKVRDGGVGEDGGVRVALQGNTHRRSTTLGAASDRLEMLDLSRSLSPEDHHGSAYVRITRGCNKFCTYCVVPNTRGAEVHRPPDHIVDECKRLVDAGVVEITLLGQTVNHYQYHHGASVTIDGVQQPQIGGVVGSGGAKAGGRVTSFADLLVRLHEEVTGLERLRFVTSYPRDFGDDILRVMAGHRRICRYLHLPAQSGSNRILKQMNRGYTVEEYVDLLDRARVILPDVQIAGDLICGFPGETEEDHQATCRLLERAQYKNCFIFKYSPRPGTAAIERFEDDVPDAVKRNRNNELLELQGRISEAVHRGCVGKRVRVFVESVSQKTAKAREAGGGAKVSLGWEKPVVQLSGRTDGDLIVVFEGEESLVGSMVDIQIERSGTLVLFGVRVNEPAEACV